MGLFSQAVPEPSAELLRAANLVGQLFQAFLRAGFTRDEALDLIKFNQELAAFGGTDND